MLGADGQALAAFHAQSTELAGTSWTATAINNGKEAVASVVKDSTVTLEFVADGKADLRVRSSTGDGQSRSAEAGSLALLALGLATACGFERANSFHDTAKYLTSLAAS